jgi:hypothetical protein
LAGENFLVIDNHLAFSAGSSSAAVRSQVKTGLGGGFTETRACWYSKRSLLFPTVFPMKGDTVLIHFVFDKSYKMGRG